ncbi:MAG TPA: HNH endonuclease signature motif containing protein, partial [Caldilineaceae bacterium]|nr:HNH endonuclease signature motif containing protein [Caldilineaceae bacterium]
GQRRQPLPVTYEWLHQKYIVEKLGCPEIGKLVDRDGSTVRYWLLKYDIPTRPRGHDVRQQFKKGTSTRKGAKLTEEAKQKIGEASRQRKQVPYLRDGQHWLKSAPKEANPSWKGGVSPERQTFYRSEEWKKAVRAVWYRDGAKCRRCGLSRESVDSKGRFHVHHIVSFANKELRTNPDNLVLLCNDCHYFVHSQENINREFLAEPA